MSRQGGFFLIRRTQEKLRSKYSFSGVHWEKLAFFIILAPGKNNRVAVCQLIKYDLLRPLAYRKKFSAVIGVPLKNVILFAIESSRSSLRKKIFSGVPTS
jgi:hypothetical protein